MSGHSGTAFLTEPATRQPEHFSFYMATEGESLTGQSNPRAPRARTVAGCWDAPVADFAETAVRWRTVSGSATAPGDFTAVTPPTDTGWDPPRPGETQRICNDIHEQGCEPPRSTNPGTRPLPVTLASNSVTDEAVRSLQVELTGGKIWGDQHPPNGTAWGLNNTSFLGRRRTLHIVDDDGPARFSLEPTLSDASEAVAYSRNEFGSSIDVWLPVFRAGSQATATTVDYELVGSGEHPSTEGPAGAAGTDFTDLTNGTVEFPATATNPPLGGDTGPRMSWIKIRLNRDFVGEEPETFDVNLLGHNNEGGATSTTFTILDSDDGPDNGPPPGPEMHPKGKLHHPKLNFKYPQNYPYLNEIHLFTANAKGVGERHPDYETKWRVLFADLAIRKRFKSGKCAWWRGSGFKPGGCNSKHWFRMKKGGGEDYFLYRVKKHMPVSVGKSNVRDYKVWSRWFDASANESTLRTGANRNLFEVTWGTKACRTNPFGRKCKPIKPRR